MKKKIPIFSSIQTTYFKQSPKFNFPIMSPTNFLSRRSSDFQGWSCRDLLFAWVDTWLAKRKFLKVRKSFGVC